MVFPLRFGFHFQDRIAADPARGGPPIFNLFTGRRPDTARKEHNSNAYDYSRRFSSHAHRRYVSVVAALGSEAGGIDDQFLALRLCATSSLRRLFFSRHVPAEPPVLPDWRKRSAIRTVGLPGSPCAASKKPRH